MEKDMVSHLGRQWKARFGNQGCRTRCMNNADTIHASTIFEFKYSKVNVKNTKTPP